MNEKQKLVLLVGISIITGFIAVWLFTGGEIFSKSQILIEKEDPLFGTIYKEWQDKFIFGLDYTAAASAVVAVISGILIYLFKSKRKETI
jgi:hypothetical protein